MNIFEKLTKFVRDVFKTSLEMFYEALRHSPNAQGYIGGSISELLLKKKLEEEFGFEVKRIREKWEGRKHPQHHGDFYIRERPAKPWFVVEVKGVKSNSEKWHKLYNYESLKNFMTSHAELLPWINNVKSIEEQIKFWISVNLPKYESEFSSNLYDFEEVQKYLKNRPRRESAKLRQMLDLQKFDRYQIAGMIEEHLNYLASRIKVLETHFVSGTSGLSERTQATPRKDEFNIIALDIALRYNEHKFLFANPKQLESSGDDPNHLQQNYIVGLVFCQTDREEYLSLSDDWSEDFIEAYQTLDPGDSIREEDMQVDTRYKFSNELNGKS